MGYVLIFMMNQLNQTPDLMNILSTKDKVVKYITLKHNNLVKGTTPMNKWHISKQLCNCWTWHKFGILSGKCNVCITWSPSSMKT
jgi:hypothetical protein